MKVEIKKTGPKVVAQRDIPAGTCVRYLEALYIVPAECVDKAGSRMLVNLETGRSSKFCPDFMLEIVDATLVVEE